MFDATDSPEDRLAQRRARRWRRRARIAAPFLAVPVVLGLLVLCVDLIEYQPTSRVDRPNEGSLATAHATRTAQAVGRGASRLVPAAALSVSAVESPRTVVNPMPEAAPAVTALSGLRKDSLDTARH